MYKSHLITNTGASTGVPIIIVNGLLKGSNAEYAISNYSDYSCPFTKDGIAIFIPGNVDTWPDNLSKLFYDTYTNRLSIMHIDLAQYLQTLNSNIFNNGTINDIYQVPFFNTKTLTNTFENFGGLSGEGSFIIPTYSDQVYLNNTLSNSLLNSQYMNYIQCINNNL